MNRKRIDTIHERLAYLQRPLEFLQTASLSVGLGCLPMGIIQYFQGNDTDIYKAVGLAAAGVLGISTYVGEQLQQRRGEADICIDHVVNGVRGFEKDLRYYRQTRETE